MRSTAPFAVSAAPAEAGQDLNTVSAYTVKQLLTLLSHDWTWLLMRYGDYKE